MDIKMRKKNLKKKYVCIINMKNGVKPMISIAATYNLKNIYQFPYLDIIMI